jgi:hypothetical protein
MCATDTTHGVFVGEIEKLLEEPNENQSKETKSESHSS